MSEEIALPPLYLPSAEDQAIHDVRFRLPSPLSSDEWASIANPLSYYAWQRLNTKMDRMLWRIHELERHFVLPKEGVRCGRCGADRVAIIRGKHTIGEGYEVEACTDCIKRAMGPAKPRPARGSGIKK
jgi:hypothetical protein